MQLDQSMGLAKESYGEWKAKPIKERGMLIIYSYVFET
tara:strand:+ start:371 stop:484 length:114 start_codon:yes stop_codon:yes gene_type:complete